MRRNVAAVRSACCLQALLARLSQRGGRTLSVDPHGIFSGKASMQSAGVFWNPPDCLPFIMLELVWPSLRPWFSTKIGMR